MTQDLPSDGLDLQALRTADEAIAAAAARGRADALRARMAQELDSLPATLRPAMDRLIDAVGQALAEAAAARQAAAEHRRERGEWLQIDPLRHIPEDRAATAPPAPSRYELDAADPAFAGHGWHGPEGTGRQSRRWSGLAPAASLIVPSLGPGTIALEIHLELPFEVPFRDDSVLILANGEPLDLAFAEMDENRAVLTATWPGVEAQGVNLGLVLLGPLVADPRGRDTRKLGVGFRRLVARRVALED